MNHLARLLVLLAVSSLAAQSLKNEDLGISITNKPQLFVAEILDVKKMDLANRKAVFLNRGRVMERVKLSHGGGTRIYRFDDGFSENTEVKLGWQMPLARELWLAYYEWGWYMASSAHSGAVQVFELREGKVFIIQQIAFDMHHGGHAVGASFDPKRKILTVRSVPFDSPKGRCCPIYINTVTFRWDGQRFVRISAKRAPISKQE